MSKITSIIDIGSNSVRMAVFKRTSRFGFYLLHEAKSKVRISQGCYESEGVLQEAPMHRCIDALGDFVNISNSYKARKILCVATSAVRDAPNMHHFIKLVRDKCNLNVRVIDGKKEAFYGALACVNLMKEKSGITIDIGGGSTECALIDDGNIIELTSINVGTIRLKEMFFDKNKSLKLAKEYVDKQLSILSSHYKHKVIFGIGGTIRAIAKVIMKENKLTNSALHGFEIDIKTYEKLFHKISNPKSNYLQNLGIGKDRIDNIKSGIIIINALLERFGSEVIITSGVGVREGVFLSDLLRNSNLKFPPNFNPSARSILDRFSNFNAIKMKKYASDIFDQLQSTIKIDEKYKEHLLLAASLQGIGHDIGFFHAHKHSSYIVNHALEYSISHFDKALICLLIEQNIKKIKLLPKSNISHEMITQNNISALIFILKICELLEFSDDVKFDIKLKPNRLSTDKLNAKAKNDTRGNITILQIFINKPTKILSEALSKIKFPQIKVEILKNES